MKRSRLAEEQIIAVLRGHVAGVKAADVRRRHGIGDATLYKWKAMFGGLDVSEARRLPASAWTTTGAFAALPTAFAEPIYRGNHAWLCRTVKRRVNDYRA